MNIEAHNSVPIEEDLGQRKLQAEKVVDFLERSGLLEKIDTFQKRQQFLHTLIPEVAEDILERINGILRDIPIAQRAIYDYRGVVKDEGGNLYTPPSPPALKNIMREIIVPDIKEIAFPESAEVLATLINLLHMFEDGNGRLARTVYFLFASKNKIDHSDEFLATMSTAIFDKKHFLNFNPNIIAPELKHIVEFMTPIEDPRVHAIQHLSNMPKAFTQQEALDSNGNFYVNLSFFLNELLDQDPFDIVFGLREFIFRRKSNPWDYIQADSGKDTFSIDCEKLIKSVSSKEEYLYMLASFDIAKTARVQAVFDIYKNPKKYPSRSKNLNVKDFYRASMMHHLKQGTN